MIERLNHIDSHTPLRGHLEVSFKICKPTEFIDKVYSFLKQDSFDGNLSRALIFVRSRKKAEEYSAFFNEKIESKKEKFHSSFFHAGMDAEERASTFDNYKNGEITVLFSTKAFGMGMNIPNVHYLFHIQPSSSFEDFLQEVGRAGREKDAYYKAGFSETKRIRTICFFDKDDFPSIRDLMKKSQISWKDIIEVNKIILDYYSKFRTLLPDEDNPLPIPFNLLNTHPKYLDNKQAGTLFRIALYWLEQLGRYEFTYFVPSYLEFSNEIFLNDNFSSNQIKSPLQQKLFILIETTYREKFQAKESSLVDIQEILKILDHKSLKKAFDLIFKAEENGYVKLLHKIKLNFTKLRKDEIKNYNTNSWNTPKLPMIEALFNLSHHILESVPKFQRREFDNKYLNQLGNEIVRQCFTPSNLTWAGQNEKNENNRNAKIEKEIKKQIKDFSKKRVKHAFWLINQIPKMKHESIMKQDTGELIHIVINNDKNEKWKSWLGELKNNIYSFLIFFKSHFNKNGQTLEISNAILKSNITPKTLNALENVLILLKRMGYLSFSGGLIPMSLDMILKSVEPISNENELDAQKEEEFKETVVLKKLRLATLETFAHIGNEKQQNDFIQKYFQSESTSEIINLLQDYVTENNSNIISEFRAEALVSAEKKLNVEQRKVYDAPINKNINVIAGPGSGKTHTLTLRVARLIQKENINPENILILAYNRAVVVELKERLLDLFSKLGYRKLTTTLNIFTFYGLIKYCLQDELDGHDFKDWEPMFLTALDENFGFVRARLGTINYVFIDEFQDITQNRLDILEKLIEKESTYMTTIGDPNQSIYGFDRVPDGPRSPKPYYRKFQEIFKPHVLFLKNNYRSYQDIIIKAENLLSLQVEQFNIGKLVCINQPEEGLQNIVEEFDVRENGTIKWFEKLQLLIDDGKIKQIALMVRTNEEIYKAYHRLKNLNLRGASIRVQGESGDFIKSRETSYFLNELRAELLNQLPNNFLQTFEEKKSQLLENRKNWNPFFLNVLHVLYFQFNKNREQNTTNEDLINFIEDFARKDDGQLYQLYETYKKILNFPERRELVLTTMHRIKGLEYECVIVIPSFANLPFMENEDNNENDLSDIYDEELRIRYVAFSRAKTKLIIFNGKRFFALKNRINYTFPHRNLLGYPVKTGLEKFIIFTLANITSQQYLYNSAKVGDAVNLILSQKGNWSVKINNNHIGTLSSTNIRTRNELQGINQPTLSGFYVTSFIQYTLEESLKYDSDHSRSYTNNWDDYCKKQGWILIPDFSGYGR